MRRTVALFVALYAWSAPSASQDYLPGIAELIVSGELRVGMIALDAPPMITTDENGNPGGYDAEIAAAIGDTLGVEVKIVRTEFTHNAVIEQVARGDVDIAISYVGKTPSRALKVLFTKPYLTQHHSLLVRRTHIALHKGVCPDLEGFLADSAELPVGIQAGTSYVGSILHAQPNAKLTKFNSFAELMQAVRSGAIERSFQGEISARHYLSEHPGMRIFTQLCILPDWQEQIAIAVNGRKPALVDFLNVFLDHVEVSMRDDGLILTIDPWYND